MKLRLVLITICAALITGCVTTTEIPAGKRYDVDLDLIEPLHDTFQLFDDERKSDE